MSISLHNFAFDIVHDIHLLLFSKHLYVCIPIFVFAGYSSTGDARIYNASELLEMMQDDSIGFPNTHPFPTDNVDMPFFLAGDNAFSLSENMQKPYGHKALTRKERILNYRLSKVS